jgi:hypothetical protein
MSASLRKAGREFIGHYHIERNPKGLGNRLIAPEVCPLMSDGPVQAAEAIGRIVELLLSSRLIRFTACDRKLTFGFLDTTGSGARCRSTGFGSRNRLREPFAFVNELRRIDGKQPRMRAGQTLMSADRVELQNHARTLSVSGRLSCKQPRSVRKIDCGSSNYAQL